MTPSEFVAAVADYAFADHELDVPAAARGIVVVGEVHGRRETPSLLYALAIALGTRAIAFEWSHEEMDEPVQAFMRAGSFDFERLWSLPASAEFFRGDGRIPAGHFALLQRFRSEGRLDQVIVARGGFHAQLHAPEGKPMAAYLAEEVPALEVIMLEYEDPAAAVVPERDSRP